MEKFQELRELAKRKITVADHILTQTYPLVKDPKLLLAVLENIFYAFSDALTALLSFERLFKRIPAFYDTFDSKFIIFNSRMIRRYNIDKKYSAMISEIREIISQHKKSPIEFSRKDKFVICDDDYSMKSISVNEMKQFVNETKEFINLVFNITSKYDSLFAK